MWSLSPSWNREAFFMITSFFTTCLCHSLELGLSTAEGRDTRRIPEQTASITRSPGGLHLPHGTRSQAGQDANTGAMQPQVENSSWYTGTDVTLATLMERAHLVVRWWQWMKGPVSDQALVSSCVLYFLEPSAVYSINKDGLNWSCKPAKLSSTAFCIQKFQWPFFWV